MTPSSVSPRSPRRYLPLLGTGVAAAAAAAAVLVASPWRDDPGTPVAAPVAATSASSPASHDQAQPRGPVLHHDAVERFLVDLEDATAPVCNRGVDIAAEKGRSFTCAEGSTHWTVRIIAVDAGGGVHYELVD